jgi:peptidyl-prolyl cis-trans isomerase SurA
MPIVIARRAKGCRKPSIFLLLRRARRSLIEAAGELCARTVAIGLCGLLGLTGSLAAAPAAAAAPTARPASATGASGASGASGAANVLKDRVLAVVDEDPILNSDLDRAIVVGQLAPATGQAPKAFRRHVLDDLIAQRLRFHEIDRFGLEQVPVDQIEKQVTQMRARSKDEVTFRKELASVGLDEAALRQMMARQLEVLAFVDERLGPQVFVGLDEIATYYRNVLSPPLAKQHLPVPPLDDVREQIRNVLRQQRLTDEIDRWTEELRRKANIVDYFDKPGGGPLPPVVKRLEPPKPAATKATPPAPSKPPGQ